MNLCKLYKFVKYILKTHRGHQCFLTISQISYNFTNSFRAEEKKKNMTDLFTPISNLLNVLLNYYFDSVYGACRGSTLPRNLIQSRSHMCTVGTTSYQSRKVRNDRGWAGGWTQWIVGARPFFKRHWWRWMFDEVNCTNLQNISSKHIADNNNSR